MIFSMNVTFNEVCFVAVCEGKMSVKVKKI